MSFPNYNAMLAAFDARQTACARISDHDVLQAIVGQLTPPERRAVLRALEAHREALSPASQPGHEVHYPRAVAICAAVKQLFGL